MASSSFDDLPNESHTPPVNSSDDSRISKVSQIESIRYVAAKTIPKSFETERSLNTTNGPKRVPQKRSNLSVLLEGQLCTTVSESKTQTSKTGTPEIDADYSMYSSPTLEADSASGPSMVRPSNKISAHLIRSAPTEISIPECKLASSYRRAMSLLPANSNIQASPGRREQMMTYQSQRFTSESGNRVDANQIKPQLVRKCISSKELGSLAPPSKASFALTLHQRDVLEAEMQQRLQEARQSNLSSDRSLDSKSLDSITSKQDASDSSECSKKRTNRQLKNESRNKRRAEATRAVTGDLCEIVTDLFIAEAKLLNPAIYGIEPSLQRDQVYRDVLDFVSELPSRYALGVNTPSEVSFPITESLERIRTY